MKICETKQNTFYLTSAGFRVIICCAKMFCAVLYVQSSFFNLQCSRFALPVQTDNLHRQSNADYAVAGYASQALLACISLRNVFTYSCLFFGCHHDRKIWKLQFIRINTTGNKLWYKYVNKVYNVLHCLV